MKKELEQLIFSGKITDTVEILGKTWTLQTVDIAEHTEVVKKLNDKNTNLNLLILKQNMISRALVSIDDIILDDKKEREEFVSKLPLAIIDKLFLKYNDMTERLNKALDEEDIEEIKN